MPHLKFDDTTLEPHVFRYDATRYVRLLTTNRTRTALQTNSTTKSPSSDLYPFSLLPPTSTKRKRKATYCLSLSRRLDRFHESPSVYDSTRYPQPRTSPLMSLPTELRHQILDLVLDNDDVLFPRPNSRTQALALTCRTFASDVRAVKNLWAARENELRRELGTGREALDDYMRDLMKPVESAAVALGRVGGRTLKQTRRARVKERLVIRRRLGRAGC